VRRVRHRPGIGAPANFVQFVVTKAAIKASAAYLLFAISSPTI
jgi:hypothetical protein